MWKCVQAMRDPNTPKFYGALALFVSHMWITGCNCHACTTEPIDLDRRRFTVPIVDITSSQGKADNNRSKVFHHVVKRAIGAVVAACNVKIF